MENNETFVSVIGGADGPTSIFLAGKVGNGFMTGIIIFVVLVLLAAAMLIFWKPGIKTKYRFIRLSVGNLMIHLMDGLVTFVNTPDLAKEGNPLVSRLGFGWGALFTANLIGFAVIVWMTWWFCRYEYVKIPSKSIFDYRMKLMYGENYRPVWVWYKFSKNYRAMLAWGSYGIYWGATAEAPVFVIGWILRMLHIRPAWWKDYWIAVILGIAACVWAMFRWMREGYRLSCKEYKAGDTYGKGDESKAENYLFDENSSGKNR